MNSGSAPSSFLITSVGNMQSSMWVGKSGVMETTMVTQFSENDLYFTTSMKIRNTGTSSVTNVYCKSFLRFLFSYQ